MRSCSSEGSVAYRAAMVTMEPASGNRTRTYALRASPVLDGGGWWVPSSAEICPTVCGWQRLLTGGRGHVRGTHPPTDLHQAADFIAVYTASHRRSSVNVATSSV